MNTPGIPAQDSLDLADYFSIIGRRLFLIISVALIVTVASLLVVPDPAQVTVGFTATTGVAPPTFSAVGDATPETEAELMRSDRIVGLVEEAIGTELPDDDLRRSLTVDQVDGTDILTVTYRADDSDVAETVSRAFAEQYLVGRTAELEADRQANLDRTSVEIDRIADEMAELTGVVAASPEESAEREAATALVAVLQNQLTRLRTEASLAAIETVETGEILRATDVTELRSRAIPPVALAAARAALGLLSGLLVGFLVDRLDPTIRSVGDASRVDGATLLAEVPFTSRLRYGEGEMPQQFYRAATAVRSAAVRAGHRSIVLAPVSAGGGYSRAIDNIAIAHGSSDRHTVMIILGSERAGEPSVLEQLETLGAGERDDGLVIVKSASPLAEPKAFDAAMMTGVLVLIGRVGRTRRRDLASTLALAGNLGVPETWVIIEQRRPWRDRLGRNPHHINTTAESLAFEPGPEVDEFDEELTESGARS